MKIDDEEAWRIAIERLYGSMEEYEKRKYDYLYIDHKREVEEKRRRKAELNRKRLKKEGLELQSINKFEEDE